MLLPSSISTPPTLDIFCRVIDNYGDAGVCGRLAKQWATEVGGKTRLFIDRPDVLKAIHPEIAKYDIILWDTHLTYDAPADIVIEAFACNLPEQVISSLKANKPYSVWINLEYLSAEPWVEDFHAIPSIHPTTGLKKTVFFPGFTLKTGGLIRENRLIIDKNAFIQDKIAQNAWRERYYLPEIDENCIDISLFCYNSAPEQHLLASLADYHRPIRVIRPEPRPDSTIDKHGQVTIHRIPLIPQQEYDRLCWTTQLNFVRGEDSFVRAQYAGKPFIWNIYTQSEQTHLIKLKAFLDLYLPFFGQNERDLLAEAHKVWNEGGHKYTRIWHNLLDALPALTLGASQWTNGLMAQDDLTTRLLRFYATQKPETMHND